MAADWAEAFDPRLYDLMREKCLAWYGGDRDCQAWEPSQDDFLSPALIEVECMRRMLSPPAFREWLGRFLPRLKPYPKCTETIPLFGKAAWGEKFHALVLAAAFVLLYFLFVR